MWIIYKYTDKDILDADGYVINKKDTWYSIGAYSNLEAVNSIINHEIYLYNKTATDDTPNPRFKIMSNFDFEDMEETNENS